MSITPVKDIEEKKFARCFKDDREVYGCDSCDLSEETFEECSYKFWLRLKNGYI